MQPVRDYVKDKDSIKNVLLSTKYSEQLVSVANREKTSFICELDDVLDKDTELCQAIIGNAKRYVQLFSEVVDELLPDFRTSENISKDTFDVFIEHRLHTQQTKQARAMDGPDQQILSSPYPAELMRRYEFYFKPPLFLPYTAVRNIKAKDIGKLVALTGIVTRNSEVKPMTQVLTYTCDSCSAEVYQPVGGTQVMPLERCVSEECRTNKANGRLHLQPRGSKFTRFQELRIQEHSRDVPMGNIPRSISVICKGDFTRQVLPGDHVNIAGIFLPMPKSGFNAMRGGGLIADTYLEVHQIQIANKVLEDDDEMTEAQFLEYIEKENISIERLAISIAPEIYGHMDLKKALLCLLVGGVDHNTNGMKIRGCINICMMGDPGVAKSQLMGFIDRLATRSQYTTGRGSSGVGLTASVMKDPVTGEFVLEGGALVLADQGICCIDEFDKMLESDRTAIHEVMEQQTISIAKAGIMTTLNARVSILAAANPTYGRYNRKRSIEQNVNLPAALLSRFDLLWLITDVADKENDYKLAQHITYVHTHERQPPLTFEPLSIKIMRKYIELAKSFNPIVPPHLSDEIVAAYINMRHEARNNQNTTYTSARCVLGIIRIATALARLRLSEVVVRGDVMEAIRLIECSKASIKNDAPKNAISRSEKIFQCIHNMVSSLKTKEVDMGSAIEQCLAHGFTNEDVEEAIEEFESNSMWMVNAPRTKIIFV